MIYRIGMIFGAALLMTLGGCRMATTIPEMPDLKEPIEAVEAVSTDLKEQAKTVSTFSDPGAPAVSYRLDEHSETLTGATAKLREAESRVRDLGKSAADLQKQLAAAKADGRRWFDRAVYAAILAATLGLGISTVLAVFGRGNILWAAVCLGVIGASLTMLWLMDNVLWVGLGMALLVVYILVREGGKRRTPDKELLNGVASVG